MTARLLITATLAAAAIAPRQPAQTCDASPLVVRNANLWTPDGVVPNRDVVFREGRVHAIEAGLSRKEPQARMIEGTGHTLLPGLVDSHLHFSVPGGLSPGDKPRIVAEEITGPQLLRSDVTAGRLHLAGLDEMARLKSRSTEPCAPMPRVQVGGPGLSGAIEKDFPNFQGARSVEDARAKIERFRQAGAGWIAIHDSDRFPPGVLTAIAGAARKAGPRLMAAGNSPPEVSAALTVAPDTLDYIDKKRIHRAIPLQSLTRFARTET